MAEPVPVVNAPVDKPADFGQGQSGLAKRWLAEIQLYDREYKEWNERCDRIVKRYRDERPTNSTRRKMNILWSNIETLKPAVYARPPKPDVQRRFKDKDSPAKAASETLERCLSYHADMYDLDGVLKKCRDDYLLAARGAAWVRYVPTMDGEEVVAERVSCEYVHRKDFGHTPARCWDEVEAVWRRSYLSRAKLVERFGDRGRDVPLDGKPTNMSDETVAKHGEVFKTATVYEIWDKTERKVIWIAKSQPDAPLDVQDDPLNLEGFFPCPKPLFGGLTNDSLIPLPDYAQYQDQAEEIDLLTSRIALLTKALKVAGFYNGSAKQDFQRLLNGDENKLIPIDDWAMFAEKGGTVGQISILPVKDIAETLIRLYEARAQVKQDLLEVTGLSDIVRGQGDPDETATAQQIKGQFASMRLTDRQNEMIRFSRDLLRIMAEIIAEQFSPPTLALMSGLQLPMTQMEAMMQAQQTQQQPMPSWEEVAGLLRDDHLRGFRIDIETDSTVAVDEAAEKEAAMELLNVATPFLEKMAMAAQMMPAALPLLGEMLMFTLRRFKAGRNLEQVFEQAMAQMQQVAQQPRPNPEEQALKLEAEKAKQTIQIQQAKAQADAMLAQQKAQADIQLAQAKAAADYRLKQAELAASIQMDGQRLQSEERRGAVQAQFDMQRMQAEHGMKREQMMMDGDLKREQAALDYDLKASGQAADTEIKRDKAEAETAIKSEAVAMQAEGGEGAPGSARKRVTQGPIAGMAKTVEQMAEAIMQLAAAMQAQSGPKRINVTRGKDGRVTGANVSTVGNA